MLEATPVKILGATVLMNNRHSLDIAETRQESLRVWRDTRSTSAPSAAAIQADPIQGDRLTISKEALQAYNCGAAQAAEPSPISVDPEFFGLSPEDRLLILILEKALGIRIRTPDQLKNATKGTGKTLAAEVQQIQEAAARQAEALKQAATAPSRAGWGYIYERHESYQESETMSFTAKGLVNTADGKQISIQIQLNMTRSFSATNSVTLRGGDAKVVDPLAINYDGPAADFKKTTFVFDLDADGSGEEIPVLGSGSGYLAVDRNGDGTINNGTELFGPSTGDGFAELRSLDADGNDWIDASDPAFESIRIWTRDDAGNDHLVALGQKGVGAIYVGNISASFSMKDDTNALQAQNTGMGIYLNESGLPGTVQEVDLVVRPPATRT